MKTVDCSRTQTRIVRVEGIHADDLTTASCPNNCLDIRWHRVQAIIPVGQLLWLSWESGCSQYQMSAVRIVSSAKFYTWQYFWLDYWWTLNNLFPLKPRPQRLHKTQWERDFSNSLRFCMRKKWCTLHCVLRRKLHRAERAFRFFPGPKWSITWTLWWTHNWIETGGSRLTGGTCRTRDSRPHSQTRWRTKT